MSAHDSLPHDAARLHVTGRARYVDDIPTPADCLHLAFGLSPIARGTIRAMDLAAVRSAPGVVEVLAGADLDPIPDCAPAAHDEPLLSDGTIHYAGQPLFLVIATSHLAARRAARLARLDLAEETPILGVDEALAANARFEEGPRIYAKGDVAAAIATADHVITGQITLGGQEHFYLEGQAALALPQDNGDMVIHASTQHPTEIQHKVADALGLPMHAVRVEVRRMGGGFGGKESQGNALAIACAIAAARRGRPAKMRYDRDDDFVITGKRHDIMIAYRVGVDATGRVLGLDFTHYLRCGWSMDLSLPVADRAMLHADNAYDLPAARITSHRLRTNHQSATAFRGFGGPQGMVGIERVMDHIAHHLGRDPLEIRRLNYYPEARVAPSEASGGSIYEAKMAKEAPRTGVTPYGMEVRDFVLHGLTERLAQSCDYAGRRAEIARWNASQTVLKRGIALSPVKFGISFTLTHLNQAGALVHVYQDGSIQINHGGTEMGQGLFQKVAQVAASRFGVGMDQIKITATDTGKVPNTSATAASSGTDLNGMAVQAACDAIRARIAEVAAPHLQAAPGEIVFAGGMLHAGGAEMPFATAVAKAYAARVSLSATGFYKTPDILHDAGASLNPALDIGQIEGGFVQGAGWLTSEELVWDAAGRLRTHAPSTYKIPACSDRPPVFNVDLWDQPNRADTIYRSKAVGEPPFMLGISVLMALSDACAACGPHYPDLQAPATPEAVLAAIDRARGP